MRRTLDASFYDCSQKPYKETITGKPHFIMLHRYCAVLQIEGLWEICSEQDYWHHFPNIISYFMSLCHVLAILTIF